MLKYLVSALGLARASLNVLETATVHTPFTNTDGHELCQVFIDEDWDNRDDYILT